MSVNKAKSGSNKKELENRSDIEGGNIYQPSMIEPKWQSKWEEDGVYHSDLESAKRPFYNLMMFPYPSAEGLHVGSVFAFSGVDIYGRFQRMQGNDVFEPIGLDGFGIHSENHAIKTGTHPMDHAKRTEENFYRQLHSIGNGFDWRHKVETYDPYYYRWTQWLFTELFKAGLAYRKKAPVNFCPSCKTVLADEQAVEKSKIKNQKSKIEKEEVAIEEKVKVCERCDSPIEKRELEQWFFRITKYADRLLTNIEKLNWTEKVKTAQRNWIGKSEGARIEFKVQSSKFKVEVFTTRPDTLFGATFLVLSPEHPLITSLDSKEVKDYIKSIEGKSDQDRIAEGKEKTGVFSGLYAVNPVNQEKIPIWIADYVLMGYGTGAIMAVPAHDQRDHDFAIKYKLPIIKVIEPHNEFQSLVMRKSVKVEEFKKDIMSKGMYIKDYYDWGLIVTGGDYAQNDYLKIIQSHLLSGPWYADADGSLKAVIFKDKIFTLPNEANEAFEYGKEIGIPEEQLDWQTKENYAYCYDGTYGKLVNSGKLNDFQVSQALNRLIELFPEKIKKEANYHLRDWLISRQRYWGPPIPMVYCQSCADKGLSWFCSEEAREYQKSKIKNQKSKTIENLKLKIENSAHEMRGWYPVEEEDLPVELPYIKDFKPLGTGNSPLANHPEFYETRCPLGHKARRETDVSDTFLDSSWYFLRYLATDWNDVPFPSVEYLKIKNQKSKIKNEVESVRQAQDKNWKLRIENSARRAAWLPVNMYIGGAEHSVLHLLYARFVTMVLYDLGYINFEEPFARFYAHGLIVKDGAKMSKSRGNVINPDEYIRKFGADTLRMYLHFLGPFDKGGDFRDTGIEGMSRFLKRVYNLFQKEFSIFNFQFSISEESLRMMHITIKGVTEDMENLRYNTAIAKLMSYYNFLVKQEFVSMEEASVYLRLLAPFAPYLTEELWQNRRKTEDVRLKKNINKIFSSIHLEDWPNFDPQFIREDTVTIAVQVNGKMREMIKCQMSNVPTSSPFAKASAGLRGASKDQKYVEEMAKKSGKVSKYLEGRKILKVIYVPGKVINFVVG